MQQKQQKGIIETQLRQIEADLTKSLLELKSPSFLLTEIKAKQLIWNKVMDVYHIASDYVFDFFGFGVSINDKDYWDMRKITDDVYRTWITGGSLESAMIALTSITLAKAVKSKASQITNTIQMLTGARATTTLPHMKQIEQTIPSGIVQDNPLIDLTDEQVNTVFLVWKTEQDSKVCPICQALEGQEWEPDDPTIPTPVIDSHPNCRCRLELKTESDF